MPSFSQVNGLPFRSVTLRSSASTNAAAMISTIGRGILSPEQQVSESVFSAIPADDAIATFPLKWRRQRQSNCFGKASEILDLPALEDLGRGGERVLPVIERHE